MHSGFISLVNIYSIPGYWPMNQVFTNGPGERGSIPSQVIPKTQKMVLDVALLTT